MLHVSDRDRRRLFGLEVGVGGTPQACEQPSEDPPGG